MAEFEVLSRYPPGGLRKPIKNLGHDHDTRSLGRNVTPRLPESE